MSSFEVSFFLSSSEISFSMIFAGRPAPGKELTNEFNVLEAGLWNSISLNKGILLTKKSLYTRGFIEYKHSFIE